MSTTNLRSLPEDLDVRWPRGMALYIEFSQLTTFPLALHRLDLRDLSLSFNKTKALPREEFLTPTARTVSFLGNPVVSLPEEGIDLRQMAMTYLYMDLTGIRHLPMWMDDTILHEPAVSFAGATLCVDVLLNENAVVEQAELLVMRPSALQAINSVLKDPIDQPFYPLHQDKREDEGLGTDSE